MKYIYMQINTTSLVGTAIPRANYAVNGSLLIDNILLTANITSHVLLRPTCLAQWIESRACVLRVAGLSLDRSNILWQFASPTSV